MNILTGIDLPLASPGGSVELLRDLYLGPEPLIAADVFMLDPLGETIAAPADGGVTLLPVNGKTLSGAGFHAYVDRLTTAVRDRFGTRDYDVIHLQHLAFGATPALHRAFPGLPKIALVHGTDLLFAAEHPTQAEVLREAAATASAVVVPTGAMADLLRQFVPIAPDRIVEIAWGVPDLLLSRPVRRSQPTPGGLRVLYAGRLTAEKATSQILATVAGLAGIELSVAAPVAEYSVFTEQLASTPVQYLGWLSRHQLWQEFDRHDLLIVPSPKLEAFGLVAVEAQACGLPVAYQPVPGLVEVLGDSALAIDFADTIGLTTQLRALTGSPSRLDELSIAGFINSKAFPLSRTAQALTELSVEVAQ